MDWLTTLGRDRVGQLLDAAPDPTVVLDPGGTLLFLNQRVAEVFGYPRDELAGQHIRVLVPDWDLAELRAATAHQLTPTGFARHRSGHTVPVELSVAALDEPEGQLTVFLHDLSARIRLEREADRMRDELIANISHELRTPLTSILGYLELLSELGEDELGPEARRLVDVVRRNAGRELRLVNDLLAVSFVDEYLARNTLELIDLTALAAQVVEEHQPFSRGADLELSFEAEDAVMVRGDGDRLVRVLENLLVNACKFSPPGGQVRVAVTAERAEAVLTVADTGIGVSEAERARLFERMYRAPGAIDRHVEGAGLGLAIAKAIVDAHSGTITIDSAPGAGTVVRVAMPLVG
jgi:two-component system phosphate regulon sensor histidine kinase PhoR